MLSRQSLSVILLASLSSVSATTGQLINSDTYFYGQSPPVYPSPNGIGTGDWAAAYAKASALVSQMTLDEKSNVTCGVTRPNGCSGNIPAIERLGFPGMCLQDSPTGVKATDLVNGYQSLIHVGASWNKNLAYQRGFQMGGEFKAKGVNVALGPVIGPLGRLAKGGRNWEGFSNDPYLAGSLAAATIKGIEERGVMTCTKHVLGYEQETNRNPSINADSQLTQSISSNVDDKTMHELYLWPFADAIRAGTAGVMCSYNRINNSYACGNSKILNGYLKTELGFQGFVVSDWYAQHGGIATAEAGLDLAMPDGGVFWGDNLTTGILNGSMPESRLTDMAKRIIAGWYRLGQDKEILSPGFGLPINVNAPHKLIEARDPASKPVIFNGAVEGHVLVKNEGGLPLKSPKVISLFGYDAKAPDSYNYDGTPFSPWTYGYESANISNFIAGIMGGIPITSPPIARKGTIWVGGGSGANTPSFISSPFEALSQRAYEDNSVLTWDFHVSDPEVRAESDACIVMINAWSTEGLDRDGIRDDLSDGLINNVADRCSNTIVVIHNAGVRLVDQFIGHPNVTSVVFAHLPGQDSGRALVSLLYGDSVFSGKLPYSVPKNESDYGALLNPSQASGNYKLFPQSDFAEGIYIDYRAFDKHGITPRYEFGYGLSYTTFSYQNIEIQKNTTARLQPYPSGPILEGGHQDLWDVIYTVTAEVMNTGHFDGAEVAQLYVGIPGAPVRQLRGFDKAVIGRGKTVKMSFELRRRDLSEWDVITQAWKLQDGIYNVWIGASSRNLPLNGTISI